MPERLRTCKAVKVQVCALFVGSEFDGGSRFTIQWSRSDIVRSEEDSSVGSDDRSRYFHDCPDSERFEDCGGITTEVFCSGVSAGGAIWAAAGVALGVLRLNANFGLGAEANRSSSRASSNDFKVYKNIA